MPNDIVTVLKALEDDAESVCRRYLSAGRRSGRYWIVGDVRNTPGRSMWVRLEHDSRGRPAGQWTDGATGEYGDLLDVIREAVHLTHFGDVMREARRFLGWTAKQSPTALHRSAIHAIPAPRRAARLFASGRPLPGTMAEAYLRDRGLGLPTALPALRFHPHCYCRADDGSCRELPALLGAITNLDGCLVGVHRTFLNPGGFSEPLLGKADIDTPRKALGDLLGNAVRFGQADDVLLAGEGIETALSPKTFARDLPCHAALSASHLAAIELPQGLKRLYIARDDDAGGRWAATRLASRAIEAGVEPIPLIGVGNDLNDDLRRHGAEGLQSILWRQFAAEDQRRYMSLRSGAA